MATQERGEMSVLASMFDDAEALAVKRVIKVININFIVFPYGVTVCSMVKTIISQRTQKK